MALNMWMLDIAREQSPSLDHLRQMAQLTLDSGYDAWGLYLEHRFAYPSAPWAAGTGAVTPDMVRTLIAEFPGLQIIPFINLLGHFEGFLYTEGGQKYREEMFKGLQACPSCPEFVALCEGLIDDILGIFAADIVHIGGDETAQLGMCDRCRARIEALPHAPETEVDGKAWLYGEHFGPLARRVAAAGRTPAVWGDMFVQHPSALDHLPAETIIFDWQYFNGVRETAPAFTDRGFRVMGCPAIQTYNAAWCHVTQSEENVREVAQDVREMGLHGVCVTTWENGLFGSYDTLFPMLRNFGQLLSGRSDERCAGQLSEWGKLMSDGLAACGGSFTPGRIRSSLKVRLMLQANPFLAWMHHAEEYMGKVGSKALAVCEQALAAADNEAEQGVAVFVRSGIEFVRIAESARRLYAAGKAEEAVSALALTRHLFDELAKVARRTHERIGGSLADIERCRIAREQVERVIVRIRRYGDGSLGYLPAFEHLTHPKFCPHDQAAWWLINKWANE